MAENKPSWDDAPEWANWLVGLPTGTWVWIEKEPRPQTRREGWSNVSADGRTRSRAMVAGESDEKFANWRELKEPRSVSVEPNMNKPSWDDAPNWANWLVGEPSGGYWRWCSREPVPYDSVGWGACGENEVAGVADAPFANWKDLKEPRPARIERCGCKPSWDVAPEWADWLVNVGRNMAAWFWFENEPKTYSTPHRWEAVGMRLLASNCCKKCRHQPVKFLKEPRPVKEFAKFPESCGPDFSDGPEFEGWDERAGHLTEEECAEKFTGEPWPAPKAKDAQMNVPGYEKLAMVLHRAYDQAARGKGKERHANGLAFHDQPMQTICDMLHSPHGMSYQAIKKIQEGVRLPTREQQVKELLGAIVYLSGLIMWIEKQPMVEKSGGNSGGPSFVTMSPDLNQIDIPALAEPNDKRQPVIISRDAWDELMHKINHPLIRVDDAGLEPLLDTLVKDESGKAVLKEFINKSKDQLQ